MTTKKSSPSTPDQGDDQTLPGAASAAPAQAVPADGDDWAAAMAEQAVPTALARDVLGAQGWNPGKHGG